VYVFGCWKCALPLREASPHWLMYGLLVNWTGDIALIMSAGASAGGNSRRAQSAKPGGAVVARDFGVDRGRLSDALHPGVGWPQIIGSRCRQRRRPGGRSRRIGMKRGASVKDSGAILLGTAVFWTAWTARCSRCP